MSSVYFILFFTAISLWVSKQPFRVRTAPLAEIHLSWNASVIFNYFGIKCEIRAVIATEACLILIPSLQCVRGGEHTSIPGIPFHLMRQMEDRFPVLNISDSLFWLTAAASQHSQESDVGNGRCGLWLLETIQHSTDKSMLFPVQCVYLCLRALFPWLVVYNVVWSV